MKKQNVKKIAAIIWDTIRCLGSTVKHLISAVASFIGRQIEKANEETAKAAGAIKIQQAAFERQAVYQQAAMNYESIAVALLQALETVAAKIGIDVPLNPLDIYTTARLPLTVLHPYLYQVARNKVSIVAKHRNTLDRCSAQSATKILQNTLTQQFKTGQSAFPRPLKIQILDTADGLNFNIQVWIQ